MQLTGVIEQHWEWATAAKRPRKSIVSKRKYFTNTGEWTVTICRRCKMVST